MNSEPGIGFMCLYSGVGITIILTFMFIPETMNNLPRPFSPLSCPLINFIFKNCFYFFSPSLQYAEFPSLFQYFGAMMGRPETMCPRTSFLGPLVLTMNRPKNTMSCIDTFLSFCITYMYCIVSCI
jgi:hypothetical protein